MNEELIKLGEELALKTHEAEIYLDLINKASMAFAVVTGDLYTKVNESYCTYLGTQKNKIENTPWREWMHPEDLPRSEEAHSQMHQDDLHDFTSRIKCIPEGYASFLWTSSSFDEHNRTIAIGRFLRYEQ